MQISLYYVLYLYISGGLPPVILFHLHEYRKYNGSKIFLKTSKVSNVLLA